MRILNIIFIGYGLFATVFGAGVQASDLKSAFLRTIDSHPAITRGVSEIDRQIARETLAKSVLRPQLELSVSKSSIEQDAVTSVSRFDGSTNRLVASQRLIDVEAWAKLGRESLLSESVAIRLESVERRLAIQLAERYINAVSAQSGANTISDLVDSLERRLIQAKQMHQAGQMSRLDLLRAENRLAQRRTELSDAKGAAMAALAALAEIDSELQLRTIHSPNDLTIRWPQLLGKEQLLDAVYATNPEIVAIDKQIAAESMAFSAIERRRLPKLGLSVTYEESDIGSNNRQIEDTATTIVGLTLTMPLYRGGSMSAELDEKASLVAQLESDLEVTRRSLLRSLLEALAQFTNSKEGAVSEIANVRGQAMAVDVLTQAFDRGAISQTELLDAYDNLANAKISRDRVILSGLLSWLAVRTLAGQFEPDDLILIDSVVAQYQS
jgi:outer membrane protein TolC